VLNRRTMKKRSALYRSRWLIINRSCYGQFFWLMLTETRRQQKATFS